MYAVFAPTALTQPLTASAMNSGPLSDRMPGTPRRMNRSVSASITSVEFSFHFTRLEHQRHKCPAPGRLFCAMPISPPCKRKGGDALIGPIIAKLNQIFVHQLNFAPLLARFTPLRQKPRRQPIRIRVQLAWPRRRLKPWLYRVLAWILFDGVARQPSAPRNLSYRHFVTQCTASNNTQKSHVYHSMSP